MRRLFILLFSLCSLLSNPLVAQQISGEAMVSSLSQEFDWVDRLYRMDAGVSEGYTIGEHTKMVIDAFNADFDSDEANDLLQNAGLSREEFAYFLAMHDLGKGPAVEAKGAASEERKKLELELGREVVGSLSKSLGLSEDKTALFSALLNDDSIGMLCKQPFVTEPYVLRVAFKLKEDAASCNRDLELFTRIKVLFHSCDASSYPGLHATIFESNEDGHLVYTPVIRSKLEQLYAALPVTAHPFVIDPNKKYSYSQLRYWHKMRQSLLTAKKPFISAELGGLVAQFPLAASHRMPWRVAQAITGMRSAHETPNWDCSKLQNATNQYTEIGDALTQRLLDEAEGIEEKLAILDEITFLHGTNSATILLMSLRDDWRLTYLGDLLKGHVAPMCGELGAGVGMDGVNHKSISCETVRDLKRVGDYASDQNAFSLEQNVERYLDPEFEIKLRMTPGCLHSLAIRLLQIRQWDEAAFYEVIETHNVIEASKEVLEEVLYPMHKMLHLMDYELSIEEMAYIKGDFEGDVPASLLELFDEKERNSCFGEEGNWYVPDPASMTNKGFVYRFHRYLSSRVGEHGFWGETYRSILMHRAGLKVRGDQDMPEVKQFLLSFMDRLDMWYETFEALVALEPTVRIPPDPELRKLIIEPFGVILASTQYQPESMVGRDEYLLHEPICFGAGGIDLLIVQEETHRQQVLELLPEALQEQMQVILYDEIDVGDYPLFHRLCRVR